MKWYVIPTICTIAFVVHMVVGYTRDWSFATPIAGTVVDKYIVSGDRARYRVVLLRSDGVQETLELRDTWGNWRTADDYARTTVGSVIVSCAYGWRWGYFSAFRRLEAPKEQ